VLVAALSLWFAIIATPDGTVSAKGKPKHPVSFPTKEACEVVLATDRAILIKANPEAKEGIHFVMLCMQDEDFEKQVQRNLV